MKAPRSGPDDPGALYHVYARGDQVRDMFHDDLARLLARAPAVISRLTRMSAADRTAAAQLIDRNFVERQPDESEPNRA
jgi:hypothetical protein